MQAGKSVSIRNLYQFQWNCNNYDYFIVRFYKKPLHALKREKYDDIIPLCTEAIESPEFDTLPCKMEVLLFRATFQLLLGKHDAAIQDLDNIINSDDASEDIKVNALIKRATLYMQLESSEKTFSDFELAIKINPDYGDIYHHRGQVLYMEYIRLPHARSICINVILFR